MRQVKNACVSSSAIPSWWSTQPSRVTLMLKVKSPMVSSVRDTRARRSASVCIAPDGYQPDGSMQGAWRLVTAGNRVRYGLGPMKTRPASWDDLRFLLAVHRDRSFFAAGKSLGVAASTVARRVEAVERSLGRVLVHRTNDGTRLDSDALRLVALAEELELGLGSLIRDARDEEVAGTVRV